MESIVLDSEVCLSEEQIGQFHERGFLSLSSITPPEEVSWLHDIFVRLFEQRAGRAEGAQFDMVGHDEDHAKPKLSQILKPVYFAPELQKAQCRANGLVIARQLLGPTATEFCDHAILKPAGYGAPTPWHQDEAFRDSGFDYKQLSIWIPLQEATPENGCMQYVPGSHRWDVLDHRSPHNDPRIHALECVGNFNPDDAVLCPLPPGGAVIHDGRTLHYAGSNESEVSRFAYVLMYETLPVAAPNGRDHYWNRDKQTARMTRRAQWWRQGGGAVLLWRKLRSGMLRSPKRFFFDLQRIVRGAVRRLLAR